MKSQPDILRRIISYRNLNSLIEYFGSRKKRVPKTCLSILVECDWAEAVDYCFGQMFDGSNDLLICEEVLKTAVLHDSISVFELATEKIRSSPRFESIMSSNFRTAIISLSSKIVVYCLNSKLFKIPNIDDLLCGLIKNDFSDYRIFDSIIKNFPKDRNFVCRLLNSACDNRNVGVVKRLLNFCDVHKISLTNDDIADSVGRGVISGRADLDFIDSVLKIPRVRKSVEGSKGGAVVLLAVMSDDTFSIKRLLDEGVLPSESSIDYLASKLFDDMQKLNGLIRKDADKKAYERHLYQLRLIVPASKGAWRKVSSRKAVRVLIDFFGLDSPEGHDLTVKLFLMQ